jgi:hypothetical protein
MQKPVKKGEEEVQDCIDQRVMVIRDRSFLR